MPGSVLVSGAGVAGSCLAWWLDRYGYAVTLVEQAPQPRTGGYVIDFWGLGYDVAEKMGVLDELRRHDLKVQEFRIVNRVGRRISGFNQGAVQKLIKGRGMSLPRSALASALYEAVKDRVDVRFGNSVTSLEDSPRGVEVTLREGEAQTFDLVIGADGLHSGVRRLCFGEETRFEHFLGYCVAAFTAQGYPQPAMFVLPDTAPPARNGAATPTLTLAIRVWMSLVRLSHHPFTGGFHYAPFLGEAGAIAAQNKIAWLELIRHYAFSGVLVGVFLLLAVVAGSLVLFDRSDGVYLWVAAAILLATLREFVFSLANWTHLVSLREFFVLLEVLIAPLIAGVWAIVWWRWFQLRRPAWIPKAIAVLILLDMGLELLGGTLLYGMPRAPGAFSHAASGVVRLVLLAFLVFIVASRDPVNQGSTTNESYRRGGDWRLGSRARQEQDREQCYHAARPEVLFHSRRVLCATTAGRAGHRS